MRRYIHFLSLVLILLAVQLASAATYYQLKVPGSIMTSAQGINVRSQVVGYYPLRPEDFKGFCRATEDTG